MVTDDLIQRGIRADAVVGLITGATPPADPGFTYRGVDWTPLLRADRLGAELGVRSLWLKDEGQNPTASFKARGLSLADQCGDAVGDELGDLLVVFHDDRANALWRARGTMPDTRRPAMLNCITGLVHRGGFPARARNRSGHCMWAQAENELPQPQPPVAFGFLKVKPDPCIEDV